GSARSSVAAPCGSRSGCGSWGSRTRGSAGRGRFRYRRPRRGERGSGRRRGAANGRGGRSGRPWRCGGAGVIFSGVERQIEELIRAGREAYDRRDYGAALARFAQVLDAHPEFADIHNFAGACLSLLGQPEAALAECDAAVALNDGYVEAHLNRAITLNELGRYEEAQRAFERAGEQEARAAGRFPSAISGRLANAHAAVGELYLQAGAPEEAAAQFRVAVALRPQFLDIRNRLAQTLIELGDLDGAEAELTAV